MDLLNSGRLPAKICLIISLTVFRPVWAQDVTNDPERIERVRQDLGYYRDKQPNKILELEAQLGALREEISQILQQQEQRIQKLEAAAKAHPIKSIPTPTNNAAVVPVQQGENVLTVCSQGCDFHDLQPAVNAASAGGEINIAAEINGTCAVINKPLRLVGRADKSGRKPQLIGGVCNGKAPLVTAAANIIIEGLEIADINISDGNGACIRLDPGTRDLTIRNLHCHNSQDGILGSSAGLLLIEDSRFNDNGFDNGQSHGVYLSGGDEVIIRRTQIISSQNAGHSLKAGANKLLVEDSIIAALNGHNSRALDLYAGGDVQLRRNIIQQGPQSDNSEAIGLGLEAARLLPSGHSLVMENNWFIFDRDGQSLILRGRNLGNIRFNHNQIVGTAKLGIDVNQDLNNHWFNSRKQAGLAEFDGSVNSLPSLTR